MKFDWLKRLLSDVYKGDHSNSFETLFNCTAKNLDYLCKRIEFRVHRNKVFKSFISFVFLFLLYLDFQSNKFNSTMYFLKRSLTIALLLFCNSLALKEMLSRKWRDEQYFNLSIIIGSVLLVGTRIIQISVYRNELNELIEHVTKTTKLECFNYIPVLESQLYDKYLNISRLMTRVLNILYCFVSMIALYLPIANNEWFLLFYTVVPWLGYKSHPGYEISLALESYFAFYMLSILEAFDNYFYYFSFYVSMKSDLYIAMISKIGDYNSEYDNDEKQTLLLYKLCRIQVDLQSFLTKFTKIFAVFVLGQGVFSLCLMTISLLMIQRSLLNFFVLFKIVSTQLFLQCFFGEMVLWKAERISNVIYCSKWYNIKGLKDRKVLLHLLHNSQKKMTFSAMGIYDFTLATFAAIIQKAYGFYAFMKNIK